ncbi:MAG: carboxyl-terminal protease, partial [Chloroflexi bacterium]|nr:carboxyl-terminal protease [Chloroflexota bacterium]
TTFGKGSVQNWVPLSNDQGAVRVTIARWLTPEERLIHEIGLEPDYPLAMVSQAAIDAGFDIESFGLPEDQIVILSAEEIQDGRDPQLDKAVEVLIELIGK